MRDTRISEALAFGKRMQNHFAMAGILILGMAASQAADVPASRSVDQILHDYATAVGGEAAVDKIETREVVASEHHGSKVTYYWQKPNKVLLISKNGKIGYDGSSGWVLSKKKRVTRLPKGAQRPLEMNANPLGYVHLKSMYSDVNVAPPEEVDDRQMDVLTAPNDIGTTKFYFDRSTHLLTRIEELGESSAYYKHVAEFSDYKDVDGVKLPFRIVHRSGEPGGGAHDLRIKDVQQNVELKSTMFSKPNTAGVVLGGKR